MTDWRLVLHPETGNLLLDDDGNLLVYDADLYPSGPPAGCCCPGGYATPCCPDRKLPRRLTVELESSCPELDGLTFPIFYDDDAPLGFQWLSATEDNALCGRPFYLGCVLTPTTHWTIDIQDMFVVNYPTTAICDPFFLYFQGFWDFNEGTLNCGCANFHTLNVKITE